MKQVRKRLEAEEDNRLEAEEDNSRETWLAGL